MCTGGVNYTQFKLATHQLLSFEQTMKSSIEQWQQALGQLGLESLVAKLTDAANAAGQTIDALAAVIDEADRLSSGDDSVTITPL